MSKTKNPITFAEGVYIREKTFDNGSSVINIDFNAKDFCNFMKEHVNDKGFVTTTIQKSQKADASRPMYMKLNTFSPKQAAKEALESTNLPF